LARLHKQLFQISLHIVRIFQSSEKALAAAYTSFVD
jgi:hypothetical protein